MLRIAHISDLHIACTPRWEQLNLKRIFGHLNWKLNRCRRHSLKVTERALEKIAADPPDLVILTGDLGQMGLPQEFEKAEDILSPLTRKGIPVFSINGNHDRYGQEPDSDKAFEESRERLALGMKVDESGMLNFPEEGIEIILLNQAQVIPLFKSGGWNGEAAIAKLDSALTDRKTGALRICAGHYPFISPSGIWLPPVCGMRDAEALKDLFIRHQISLYLCGHIHAPFRSTPFDGCLQLCCGSSSITDMVRYIRVDNGAYEIIER
ncbi:MAG: metallophosphoesterase [Planctomycetes bacterium]|nr:metallophosphoesterase [Planctomycetota bacterium]